jgi:hypothetical protein
MKKEQGGILPAKMRHPWRSIHNHNTPAPGLTGAAQRREDPP